MDAMVGDRIVIRGHHTGQPERICQVTEVRGADGGPPYLVRWDDSGHETLYFPGTDATIEHTRRRTAS
jgi:uncharacterized protein DUF1918